MSIKITIDPGHGKYGNPYPPRPGYYEGTQMWKLSTYLKPELEKYGFQVVTTRPKVTDDPALSSRGKLAAGHDLIISLHSNAPARASDTKPTGSVIFRTIETPGIKPLCDKIGQRVSEIMGPHYRGTRIKESGSRPGKNYNGVLRNAMAAGCKAGMLIEHGFHTNLKDSAFLIKDENLKKLAAAEAEIIAEYYKKGGESMALKRGDKGSDVKKLQQDLMKLGYNMNPYGADGSFGAITERVLMAWQKDNNLQVDGRYGPASKAKMAELLKAPEKDYKKLYEAAQKKVKELEAELARVKKLAKQIVG